MADIEKTIDIIFAGKDEVSKTFATVSGSLDKFSQKTQEIAKPLANAADTVLKLDAALAAMAVAGLALATNEAGKFNDSFAEISTLVTASDESLSYFKDSILDYSRTSTASLDDINRAVYTAISAGVEYKDALTVLTQAEKLSVAGKADLESTIRVLVSSLNAYGKSTDEAANFADALFMAVKDGQTTLPELASSLSRVSTIAANSGVSFDELMAAIAAVTATGSPTTEAMTSIKAAISAIIKPSAEARDTAKELGISFNASALATKGLDGVLKDVYKATGGATEQIVKLFGSTESLPAVLTLGADASGKFAAALTDMKNKAGAVTEAYGKMAENFGLINQNIVNNIKATLIEIGEKTLERYLNIGKEIGEFFAAIGTAVDSGTFDPLFKALDNFGLDIQNFFDALGRSLPEALKMVKWDDLLDAFGDLGDAFKDLFGDFDPADPKKVADAIQFVIESVETLIRVTAGMVKGFKPFLEGILNSVEAFNRLSDSEKEASGEILALAKALVTLGTGITAALIAIGDNADDITRIFKGVAGAIELTWGSLKAGIQTIAAIVLEAAGMILSGLEKVTWGDWNKDIRESRVYIENLAGQVERRLLKSVVQVHSGWDKVTDAISGARDKVSDMGRTVEEELVKPMLDIDFSDVDWSAWDEGFREEIQKSIPVDARIDVKTDKKQISKEAEEAKKKIESTFTKASMAPVDLQLNFNGSGVGAAFRDDIKKEFAAKPLEVKDIFDPSGIADLFGQLEGKVGLDRLKVEKAIEQQLTIQRQLADVQLSAANTMYQAAQVYTSSGVADKTIKIEAKGLEPEMEAFMWKLLKKIQVRANESGAEFLLAASS